MQWLYRMIGQVGIFLICAQTVVHFRPKESYEKYMKLLLSVMLLIQLLQPVILFLGGRDIRGAGEQVTEFTTEFQKVLENAPFREDRMGEEITQDPDITSDAVNSPEPVKIRVQIPPIEIRQEDGK